MIRDGLTQWAELVAAFSQVCVTSVGMAQLAAHLQADLRGIVQVPAVNATAQRRDGHAVNPELAALRQHRIVRLAEEAARLLVLAKHAVGRHRVDHVAASQRTERRR